MSKGDVGLRPVALLGQNSTCVFISSLFRHLCLFDFLGPFTLKELLKSHDPWQDVTILDENPLSLKVNLKKQLWARWIRIKISQGGPSKTNNTFIPQFVKQKPQKRFLFYFLFPTFLRETINLFEYFFGVLDF